MKKIILLFFTSLLLCGCTVSIDNKIPSTNKEVVKVDESTSTQEIIECTPNIPNNDSKASQGEDKDIAYTDGGLVWIHDKFFETYSDKEYQSFSKESLIDLYGDGDDRVFSDGIGFVSNKTNSQFFVFRIHDDSQLPWIENFYSEMADLVNAEPTSNGDIISNSYTRVNYIVVCYFGESDVKDDFETLSEEIVRVEQNNRG